MSDSKPTKKVKKSIVIRMVNLEKIHPNVFNYNRQTNFIFEKQKESIRKYGFIEPIVCRDDSDKEGFLEIVNGEHRYLALIEMFKADETVYLDMAHTVQLKKGHIPVHNLGGISRSDAQQLCIALNEIKGKPDNDVLADNIAELRKMEIDLSALPYTETELESYIRLATETLDFSTQDEDEAEDVESEVSEIQEVDLTQIQEDVIEEKSTLLLIDIFALDNLTKEEAEDIYAKFVSYLKSNKILRSEGHRGLLEIFNNL